MFNRVVIEVTKGLPKLSWLADIQENTARIHCGDRVQSLENSIFEGGWSGYEDPFLNIEENIYFGSGVSFKDDRICILTPSHTLESVFFAVYKTMHRVLASNSLAFIVSRSRPFGLNMEKISLYNIEKGINEYQKKIFSNHEMDIYRFSYSKIVIDENLNIIDENYKNNISFSSYDDYIYKLENVIKNVRVTSKKNEMTAFLSKGYDSVACAALMKRMGGGDVITITQSRNGDSDSGEDIAKQLNLNCYCVDRPVRNKEFSNGTYYEEITKDEADKIYEFYNGMDVGDECLNVPDEFVKDRVVLTGFHGDAAWERNYQTNNVIKRSDCSGSSLYEYRLRNGFVHIPVPMIGIVNHDQINAISNSDEMKNWSIAEKYDRPISRRLAEDEGVSRHLFGQKKQAAVTMTKPLGPLKNYMFERLVMRYTLPFSVF